MSTEGEPGEEEARAELLFALQNDVGVFAQCAFLKRVTHTNSLVVFPSVLATFAHEEPGHGLIRRTSLEHNAVRNIVSALRALFANLLPVRHLRLVSQRFRRLLLSLQLLHYLSI